MTSEKMSNEAAVLEWLGLKPNAKNVEMVYDNILTFLDSTDEDGKCFNDVDRSELEIAEWVIEHAEREYDNSDEASIRSFCKKVIVAAWKKWKDDPVLKEAVANIANYEFIEKMIEDEKAKTLPDGYRQESYTFSTHSGRSTRTVKVVKDGKWVKL